MAGLVRRSVVVALAVSSVGLVLGCIPPPPSADGLACEPITLRLGLDPALGTTPTVANASLFAAAQTACTDTTGNGITFASIESFSVRLQGAICTPDVGLTGEGSGTLRTSDGTISRVELGFGADGPATGNFSVRILEGPLAGYSTLGRLDLRPVVGGGDCGEGVITAEAVASGIDFRRRG